MPLDMPLDDSTAPAKPAEPPQRTAMGPAATIVAPGKHGDPVAALRAANAKAEKARAERTQKLIRNISLGIFAVVAMLVTFVMLRPPPVEVA
jgi:hypothetical protein